MTFPFRRPVALGGLVLCLSGVVAAQSASVPEKAEVSFDDFGPGVSVVGPGVVHPRLTIESSGGNDVVVVKEGANPAAYAGNKTADGGGVFQAANGCLGAGFADVGSGFYTQETKKHQYVFTFAGPVSEFSVRMRDWGDYLPFGANEDQTYSTVMTAYNAGGGVVDTDAITFTAPGTALARTSNEFGFLRTAGDACDADEGEPGNYVFRVSGSGITRVELSPRDRPSTDPHIAFSDLQFTLLPDADGDGVSDAEDVCPDSVTSAEFPKLVVGPHVTSVNNANNVSGPGCSIQDMVDEITRTAKNHGHFVNEIRELAAWLVARGYATPAQAQELHQAAAHKKSR